MKFNLIQALRFFAAFSVVILHTSYYLLHNGNRSEAFLNLLGDRAFGYAVFLFFTISGFVLTPAVERSTLASFLARRWLRLYPAFWLAVCLAMPLHLASFGTPLVLDWRTLTLLPFGIISYPLGVEWSLIYEVFFYAVLAAISLLRSRRLINLSLLVWTLAILVCSLSAGIAPPLPTWNTIPLSLMNLSFVAGVVSYRVYPYVVRYRWLLLVVALVSLCYARLSASQTLIFCSLPIGFGALVTFAAAQCKVRDLSGSNLLVRLGDCSYGIYLLHVPLLLALLRLSIATTLPTWLLFALCLSLALLLGSGFGWVELRFYQMTKRLISRPPT